VKHDLGALLRREPDGEGYIPPWDPSIPKGMPTYGPRSRRWARRRWRTTGRFLVMRPASDIIQPLTLTDGTHIKCLQALSILDSEMASKTEHSAEAPL